MKKRTECNDDCPHLVTLLQGGDRFMIHCALLNFKLPHPIYEQQWVGFTVDVKNFW